MLRLNKNRIGEKSSVIFHYDKSCQKKEEHQNILDTHTKQYYAIVHSLYVNKTGAASG